VTINGTAILRMRDGKVVEHWGGPHCTKGVGLIAEPGDIGERRYSAPTPR
jgi:hypothetical protein